MMDFAMLAILIGGGAFVWINKDELLGGLNKQPGVVDCTLYPSDPSCVGTGSGDSGNCKSLCTAGDCDGYDSEGCSKGCSKCQSGGGSGSGSGSGGNGSSVNCNDGHSCGKRCLEGWCTSYKACCRNHAGGCAKCNVGGSGGSTNCPDLCRRSECSTYRKRGCSGCSKCSCSKLCASAQCGTYRNANCSGGCSNCSSGGGGGSGGGGSSGGGSGGGGSSGGGTCSKAGKTCGALGWKWRTGSKGGCVCVANLGRTRFEDLVYPYSVAVSARFEDVV